MGSLTIYILEILRLKNSNKLQDGGFFAFMVFSLHDDVLQTGERKYSTQWPKLYGYLSESSSRLMRSKHLLFAQINRSRQLRCSRPLRILGCSCAE